MQKNKKYEDIVSQLKACGKSLCKNAETIVGGYEYQTGELNIQITLGDNLAPIIKVEQELLPEEWVHRKE